MSITQQLLTLFILQVWQASSQHQSNSSSPRLICAPYQEIICPSEDTFAWCMFTSHRDQCPSGLYCDPTRSYICSEERPHPPYTTPSGPPETTTADPNAGGEDPEPPIEEPPNKPWDESTSPPSTCTKPGRYPDSDDCAVFHVCLANLTHMTLNCPRGSHFSAAHDRCVEPERAKCDENYRNFECPDIGPVADPEDCDAFRLCHPDGTWRRYHCPAGSSFDARRLRCSTSVQECARPDPDLGRFRCESRGLFPDAKSCRKFYYCIPMEVGHFAQGEAHCPRGSVFNPDTARCTVDLSACRDVDKFCARRRDGKYPGDPENCASFYLCRSAAAGGSREYFCPYGSSFDAVRGRCEYESASHCAAKHHNAKCRREGRFPDFENDCAGFYVCLSLNTRWKMQRYKCPEGSKFDFRRERCLAEENVMCHVPIILL